MGGGGGLITFVFKRQTMSVVISYLHTNENLTHPLHHTSSTKKGNIQTKVQNSNATLPSIVSGSSSSVSALSMVIMSPCSVVMFMIFLPPPPLPLDDLRLLPPGLPLATKVHHTITAPCMNVFPSSFII